MQGSSLVTVSRIDDEHVSPYGGQFGGTAGGVAIDANGHSDHEFACGIERRGVDR